jgi:hypothetical protein
LNSQKGYISHFEEARSSTAPGRAHHGKYREGKYCFARQKLVLKNVYASKIGQTYYRQVVGIPQGSVLSSILCSFFYGDLEKNFSKFTNDGQSVRHKPDIVDMNARSADVSVPSKDDR